jgi:superfamily II DNA/RNA helicase
MLPVDEVVPRAKNEPRMLPRDIQTLLFSATFPDKVMGFAQKFAPKANEIKLQKNELTVKGISQMYMDCPSEQEKYDVLVKLYGLMTVGSSVIFVKVCNFSRTAASSRVFSRISTNNGIDRLVRAPARSRDA